MPLKTHLCLAIAVAFSAFAGIYIDGIVAQEGPELVRDANAEAGADAPSASLILRVSAKDGGDNRPRTENSNPPVEPMDPGVENDDDNPTFFGEPITGSSVFVIDVSFSMTIQDVGAGEDYDGNTITSMTRLEAVKIELVNMLKKFNEDIAFDIVWLAGMDKPSSFLGHNVYLPITDAWRGELTFAEDHVLEEAIKEVKAKETWWGTPTYKALERATQDYGDELAKLVLLTDGVPYPEGPGYWGTAHHKDAILDHFPRWFKDLKSNGCDLMCVHVGQGIHAGTFVQDLCAVTGGKYVHR